MCSGVPGEEGDRAGRRSAVRHEGPEESHAERYDEPLLFLSSSKLLFLHTGVPKQCWIYINVASLER